MAKELMLKLTHLEKKFDNQTGTTANSVIYIIFVGCPEISYSVTRQKQAHTDLINMKNIIYNHIFSFMIFIKHNLQIEGDNT